MDEAPPPPPGPPPLLDQAQLSSLIYQGHLPISLPRHLTQLHSQLNTTSKAFFTQPTAEKTSQYPQAQGTELGYYHVPNEKEYLTLRHRTQRGPSDGSTTGSDQDLEYLAAETWKATAALLYRIIAGVSRALGVPLQAWDLILDGSLTLPERAEDATPSLLRMFRYEPDQGVAAPHRDNGILTLCVGEEKGLQVWTKPSPDAVGAPPGEGKPSAQGEWTDAQGPTLLAGHTLHYLSAGRCAAGNHRVVANPAGRSSVVLALRPSTRHFVDLGPFGGEGVWDMKEVWKAVSEGRVNVNAVKEVRERKIRERREARERLLEEGKEGRREEVEDANGG